MNLARIPQAANCYKWVYSTVPRTIRRRSKATVRAIRYNDVVWFVGGTVSKFQFCSCEEEAGVHVGARRLTSEQLFPELNSVPVWTLAKFFSPNAPPTRSGTKQSVLDTTRYQYHTSLSTRFILVVASAVHSYSCTRTSNTSCGQCLSRRQSGEQEQVQKVAGRAGQARA